MFIKVIPNNRGKKGTYYCQLVESYREHGKIKHRIYLKFGLMNEEQVRSLKKSYAHLLTQPHHRKKKESD